MNQTQHPSAGERRLTVISVMIVFMLSSMSQTIIGTAMPRIVSELKGLHLYAWGTTSYLLASTVTVPIWGKLGDLFGRKSIMLVGIAIFLAGSWLAGLAGEFGELPLVGGGMIQLILSRVIQGIGGGALFTTTFAIIADLYAPRERARFTGVFGSVFGAASVIGPVIGGFLTDHGTVRLFGHLIEGWRWVFYVNVPFALAAVGMIVWKMPGAPGRGEAKIDYLGAALILAAFVPLLLAVTWGGREQPWLSPLIVGLFAVALLALAAFIVVERAAWDPIIPLDLFSDRTFTPACAAAFVYQMAFMGITAFLPLYIQVGLGIPATESGLIMLSALGGMIASSSLAGQLVTRTGRYKPVMIGGGVVLIAGAALLTLIGPQTSPLDLALRLLVLGIGLGPGQSLFMLAVQNTTPPHRMGVATSSSQFVRQIGGTIGVALFGAVLTSALAAELVRHTPPTAQVRRLELGDLQRMAIERDLHRGEPRAPADAAMEQVVRESFSAAVRRGLIFTLGTVILGFILMLLIPVTPLRESHVPAAGSEPKAPAEDG